MQSKGENGCQIEIRKQKQVRSILRQYLQVSILRQYLTGWTEKARLWLCIWSTIAVLYKALHRGRLRKDRVCCKQTPSTLYVHSQGEYKWFQTKHMRLHPSTQLRCMKYTCMQRFAYCCDPLWQQHLAALFVCFTQSRQWLREQVLNCLLLGCAAS